MKKAEAMFAPIYPQSINGSLHSCRQTFSKASLETGIKGARCEMGGQTGTPMTNERDNATLPTGILSPESLPWAPLLTVTRSGLPETTLHGIVYAWAEDRSLGANAGRTLIKAGNTQAPLWTRSLLKPYQLLTIYPVLKEAYPILKARHFALMAASHQGDPAQMAGLREILTLTDLPEPALQCPGSLPANRANHNEGEHALCHACSGKHLAHLLYFKAKGLPLADYLAPTAEPYQLLQILLEYLLNRPLAEPTRDGCGMPNFCLNAIEIAQLYHALLMPVSRDMIRQSPEEVEPALELWNEVSSLLQANPLLLGGVNRLDSRLMQSGASPFNLSPDTIAAADKASGEAASDLLPAIFAKEGADGLFAFTLGPCKRFPDGLGALIKLASGHAPKPLESIVRALFQHWNLPLSETQFPPKPTADSELLQTHYHFLPTVS